MGCGYLPTVYLPPGYLPIGAAATGGGSLRGKSAAAATLSMATSPAVTIMMIFITLSPLFVEALGRATEGRPYLPPAVERFPPLHIFDPSQSTTSRATKFLTKG